MKVVVDNIPPEGLVFSEDHDPEWLTNIPEFQEAGDTTLHGPIRLSGRVTLEGQNLRLQGEVTVRLHTLCTRCGDEVDWPLGGAFELVLMPKRPEQPPEEQELTPGDMDHLYYQGPEVQLDDYFREELALDVPLQMLCQEDCRGLCARCGANLNREKCSCTQPAVDPRLKKLLDLKIKS